MDEGEGRARGCRCAGREDVSAGAGEEKEGELTLPSWPYKFVHALFAKLLQQPGFELHAHTPAVEVLPCRNSNMEWTVATARGDIRAKAVVYANNRWVEHLAPEFRGVITAARNQMAAIRLDGSGWANKRLDEQAMQFWDGLHNVSFAD